MQSDTTTMPFSVRRASSLPLFAHLATALILAALLWNAPALSAQDGEPTPPPTEKSKRHKAEKPNRERPDPKINPAVVEDDVADDAPEKKEFPDVAGDDAATLNLKRKLRLCVSRVRSGKRDTIYQAAVELGDLGEAAKATLKAVRAVQKNNDDSTVQIGTRYALARMGDAPDAHIDWLNAFIAKTGEDRWLRIPAMWALGGIGERAARAAKNLATTVRAHWEWDSAHAAATLGQIGPVISDDAKLALIESLEPYPSMLGNEFLISQAAIALGKVKPDPAKAVEPLIKAMKNIGKKNAVVCASIARTLGEFGEAAAPALSALTEQITNSDEDIVIGSLYSLGRIGTKAAASADAVKKLLESAKGEVAVYAHFALAGMGSDLDKQLEALKDALSPAETTVAAAQCLATLGPRAATLADLLERMAKAETNEIVKKELEAALAAVKPK